jgi:hypothetical protein
MVKETVYSMHGSIDQIFADVETGRVQIKLPDKGHANEEEAGLKA